ncbi:MAG: hypothetical protein KY459_02395 [Acidobacteria bacterium]|nr:hypothetical protein [Acidobacteriota bacterium]
MVKRILALLGLAVLIVVVLAFGRALYEHKVASDGDLIVVAGADEILFLSHGT